MTVGREDNNDDDDTTTTTTKTKMTTTTKTGQVKSGQTGSPVFSAIWRAARRKFCFCNPSPCSAEKNFATLDWVTRFLWYLGSAEKILLLQP